MFSWDESLARRPRTPDPFVVRPLDRHRGGAGGHSALGQALTATTRTL